MPLGFWGFGRAPPPLQPGVLLKIPYKSYRCPHMMFDTYVSTNHAVALLYDLLQYLRIGYLDLHVSKAYRWIGNTRSLFDRLG